MLVAPVTVGDNSLIGRWFSYNQKDVPSDSLSVERSKTNNKGRVEKSKMIKF